LNWLKLDNHPPGGSLFYLQKSLPEKDNAAPWKNLFEQAGDAAYCTKNEPFKPAVGATSAGFTP
jgi:hypothetical protein